MEVYHLLDVLPQKQAQIQVSLCYVHAQLKCCRDYASMHKTILPILGEMIVCHRAACVDLSTEISLWLNVYKKVTYRMNIVDEVKELVREEKIRLV